MNKAIKYATNGALICGTINAIINIFNQIEKKTIKESFNWEELLKSFAKGAFVGGAGGLAFGAIRDNEMTNILAASGGTVGYIKNVLENYSDNDITLPNKAKQIQKKLYNEFKENLSEYPTINGSIIKGTAIQNSDIDVQIRFNKKSGSIESIRNQVEDFLNEKYYDKRLTKIRSQNYSIGLVYEIYGEEKRIDIVPMREIENGKGDTYIISTKSNTIKKTNAKKQINVLNFTNKQKQIIKLLKGWKIDNGLKLSSTLIEHIVKRAFKDYPIPRGLEKGMLFILEYLANRITTIRIVDPANTNNIISDYLTYNEKVEIQNFCYQMLDEVKRDKRNLLDYFVLN